jgi:ribonucleoside-diphosphate reductase alpha chain
MDLEGFAVAAGLAVRLLDNALVVAGHAATRQVRVGLIGMADALERLGIAYASPAARQSAAEMARMLLHGSLHGAMDLTMERGGGQPVASRELARLQQTGVDPGVLSAMARHGLRRLPLVGLFGAPRLARLANSLAEATDPVRSAPPMIESRSTLDANGTSDLLRGGDLLAAQLQLRAAMQPWFVTPIEQPLVVSSIPADEEWQDTLELASRLGLPPPSWHQVDSR